MSIPTILNRTYIIDLLKRHECDEHVNMWGAVLGSQNISRWNRLEVGDKILVYSKGIVHYYGEIYGKTHNPYVAQQVWGTDNNGQTWEYIYFIRDLVSIEVSREDFASFFGYKLNFIPQGFNNIRSVDSAIGFLANRTLLSTTQGFKEELAIRGDREVENNLEFMSDEQFLAYINNLNTDASIAVKEGLLKVRRYNKRVIDGLKELYEHRCQICGRSSIDDYGVSVVEGHHIAEFSITQNNSPDNIMILCPDYHRIIHKAKEKFDKEEKIVVFSKKS